MSNLNTLPHLNMLQRRVDAAQGRIDCDLILKNARYLDVFSCEWRTGDIAIIDGVIVATESGLRAKRTHDCSGRSIVPGFVDAHVHVESSMMTPSYFEEAVLTRGTTSVMCDPHELANVMGLSGIQYFLDASETLHLDMWVMLSSCVPATHMETNGGGIITAEDLVKLAPHSRALGLAEMMNMPGVTHADPEVLKKIVAFADGPMDGHCPLLKGQALSAYAATGISSCHESSELGEAQEKLTKGMAVWIREGSVAKDLKALSPLLNLATSTSIGFCTDDRNPLDIAQEGHIDHLIRGSIEYGVAPEVAYRSASWSVARHYGLASGRRRIGAVAPSYQADLVILDDVRTCSVGKVIKNGIWVSEREQQNKANTEFKNSIRAVIPEAIDFEGPKGLVHVIGILEGKIITDHRIKNSDAPGVAKLTVLERYGKKSKPDNGYVEGFGESFKGAIASSVGHDSHNLIAVGQNSADMKTALAALAEVGGGFCVVQNGNVLARLALPFAGLMSHLDPARLKADLENLKKASRSIGCALSEPFLQLAFLSLPVIPSLKLTDQGLVDVDQFRIIDVRAS
ncbi:MAG: adenine deaminase [Bdellovibrionia bacterium]